MADRLYADAYKALPNAKLVAVENSEHFIMLDQPQRFAEEVTRFLETK
jgi:pimeloyl-ACP methyl ester carboxylesterase